jgi:hypothetical protein
MRWRILSLFLALGSWLLACYFGWSMHRISGEVLLEEARNSNPNWPRPRPYPDKWLLQWNDQLVAEDPGAPGGIRMHGELAWMKMKLLGWIVVSVLVGICFAVHGLSLVPYISFTVPTREPIDAILGRLSTRINRGRASPSAREDYYQGVVWDSGFKLRKVRASSGECPLVVCGRFKLSPAGLGDQIHVTARLFGPVLWLLFLWIAALAGAIGLMVAIVETGKRADLLEVLVVLAALAPISWAIMVIWFRVSGRKSLQEITELLTDDAERNRGMAPN